MLKIQALSIVASAQSTAIPSKGTDINRVKFILKQQAKADCLIVIKKLEDRTNSAAFEKATKDVTYVSFDQWYGQVITNLVTSRMPTMRVKPGKLFSSKKAA